MKNRTVKILIAWGIILLCCTGISCKKFLDEKPDKKLVIPSSLRDLQAILDYSNTIIINDPTADEASADNYYLPTDTWQNLEEEERRQYIWEKGNIFYETSNDWSYLYAKIYSANTVLDNIEKTKRTPANAVEWDNIKGQALMIRGKAFLQAALIWSPAYDPASSAVDMGIPLRLSPDFTETSIRPSLQQTYDQVIADFKSSIALLPPRGIHSARACRAAAFGFLARTYLSMRNYPQAGLYADSSLQLNSSLLDYNSLDATASYPIPLYNPEIDFFVLSFSLGLYPSYAKVDTILYNTYAANDCRKNIFFQTNADGSQSFKGSYNADDGNFTGIATDEIYLMRAEAFARANNTAAALADLNKLMEKRITSATFIPLTANDPGEALTKILQERRKELLFRGLRWMDIKRLNKEGAGIVQKRIIDNQTYTLAPNGLRYALTIPEYVIAISGMPQNP